MFAALLLAATVADAQADVAGLWRTPDNGGVVEISHCPQGLCGRLLTSNGLRKNPAMLDTHNKDDALRSRRLKGLELFKDFKGSGGDWHDGEIYNPRDGGTYHASLKLEGADALKVTGCLFWPFCRTETWTRLPLDPDAFRSNRSER